jgi:glycosyltransferase involved in cell wall biosynthesis
MRAPQTWSGSRWFDLTAKTVWRLQRLFKVPYLNLFSNFRHLDACLQCLPNHDLVYERNSLYRFAVAQACQRLKLPYVLYFEADDVQEHDIMGKPLTGLLRWQAKRAIRYNLQAADRVIVVSDPLKAHLITAWQIPAEKIVVFPNVADVHRFRPDAQARAEVRAALGLVDQPLVIFVGNFYEWHDVTTLLHAFARLLTTHPEAHLILVGDGERRQAMQQLATELGLGQAVQFLGLAPHSEVPRYLAAADIAVVPYPILNMDLWLSPLKLYEYMAAGKAIIASDVGQIKETIQSGQNGLLVPPQDVSAMVTALQELMDNSALCAKLGAQAREHAVCKHSWEHYVARLEELFATVVAGRPISIDY